MPSKPTTNQRTLAALRGAERRASIESCAYHLYRPTARPFGNRRAVANKHACRGKQNGDST